MLFIIVIAVLGFCTYKYISDNTQNIDKALSKALRRTSYNLDYIDKQANVIALGANVSVQNNKVTIEIPTRGIWQISTNPQVAQCLMDRVESKEFKRFLDLNYNNVTFSKP